MLKKKINQKIKFVKKIILFLSLCSCQTMFNIKAKQSEYKIIKADLKKEKCDFKQVNFQEQKDGIFITNQNFTILTKNINNFKYCYNIFFEKAISNLNYYEEIIKTLGGNFN